MSSGRNGFNFFHKELNFLIKQRITTKTKKKPIPLYLIRFCILSGSRISISLTPSGISVSSSGRGGSSSLAGGAVFFCCCFCCTDGLVCCGGCLPFAGCAGAPLFGRVRCPPCVFFSSSREILPLVYSRRPRSSSRNGFGISSIKRTFVRIFSSSIWRRATRVRIVT